METIVDQSYGVVPLQKQEGQWKVFLIHQYGSRGDLFWTFPKGHQEEGETPAAAALRELYEETGLSLLHLYEEKLYEHSYTYVHEDVQIDKTASYFAGEVSEGQWKVQEDEVHEAGWFSFEEARKVLTFDAAKDILDAVEHDCCA